MKNLNSSVNIKVDITNTELLLEINTICIELSITLDQFITYAINKLLYDIKFVHNIRSIDKNER
ncbi:MAG: hypothetical protein LKE46_14890 [Clostridium sp.]|uniref:hypothetical protein n=1 Tax=Clostridium sp. TaxID=1506 RepID=UPI0025BEC1E9|nr:hypothetical protein [Clostridium sp.]MCH3965522.1 hypothetical protein [Clostridium sp.]MCI1716851.1 hypothetical protein [Clostridium sp.]MCI1801219.1 hypothetical protein [Clostridium sp.]MCI1815037.1 hypothetical protein [Clostridium sp.]MCI1871938.1 hypothetical protein [Clostridium sp.]